MIYKADRDIYIEKIGDQKTSGSLVIAITQEFLDEKVETSEELLSIKDIEILREEKAKKFIEKTKKTLNNQEDKIEKINDSLSAIIFATSELGHQNLQKYLMEIFPL